MEPAAKPKAPARLQIELRKPSGSAAAPSAAATAAAATATTEAAEKQPSPVITAEPVNNSVAAVVAEKTSPADEDMDANAHSNGNGNGNDASAEAAAEAGSAAASVVVIVPSSAPPHQDSEVVAVQSSKTDEIVSDVHPEKVVKDVSDHLEVKGGRGMDPVIHDHGGGMVNNMSSVEQPPSHKEAEGVLAVESEVSKGVFRASTVGIDALIRVPSLGLRKSTISCKPRDVVGISHLIETLYCVILLSICCSAVQQLSKNKKAENPHSLV